MACYDGDTRNNRVFLGVFSLQAILWWICLLAPGVWGQHPATCEVQIRTAGGSGVCVVNSRELNLSVHATAYHVVEGNPRYATCSFFYPEIGKRVSGKLVTFNSRHDITLAAGPYVPGLIPARIARHRPAVGERVVSDGFPHYTRAGQGTFCQLKGVVTAYQGGDIRTSAQPESGQSGAPLYNANWELCGLVDGYTGSLYDGRREKSFGPWLDLSGNCPALNAMIAGWEKYSYQVTKRRTRLLTRGDRLLVQL